MLLFLIIRSPPLSANVLCGCGKHDGEVQVRACLKKIKFSQRSAGKDASTDAAGAAKALLEDAGFAPPVSQFAGITPP